MKLKFKKLHINATIPKYAKAGDAGMDLACVNFNIDEFGNMTYYTGLATEFPPNFVGLLFPRSSVIKYNIIMANCVGVLDSSYRGEILVKFKKTEGENSKVYEIGDRVAQLVFLELPKIEIEEVLKLSESERGVGGFGSTGK